MARAESGGDGEEEVVSRTNLSIPRGGPIYTSNLMSPLTRVPIFESDILREIQSLEAELAADCSPSSTTDDDVSYAFRTISRIFDHYLSLLLLFSWNAKWVLC
uniref:Uncharacterized protein n=1 Tax=Rhizophora mucronata TaxID=61149 RepID=A0A2P2MAQ4_RHIMU